MARESREGDGRVLTWWACPYLARPHLRLNYACAQPGTVVVRLSSFPPQFLSKLKVVNVVSASQRRPIEFPQTQIGQDTSVVPLQNNWYHSEFPLPEEKQKQYMYTLNSISWTSNFFQCQKVVTKMIIRNHQKRDCDKTVIVYVI